MAAGDTQLRFEVLGTLRVLRAGEVLTLGGSKPRALLGMLLLHPNAPIGLAQLTEALWDGEPPASATVNLRTYVHTLRRALDVPATDGKTRLQTRAPGYLIRVERGELDLLDFHDLDARGRQALERGDAGAAARLWRQALDLWRGGPLDEIRGGPRLHAAVVRVEEHRRRVAEAWIDAKLAVGGHAEMVSELRGMVTAEPLHEPLWARLIIALHRAGRTADALAAFDQAREHLVEELGVEPGPQLQSLQRAVLTGDTVTHGDEGLSHGWSPPAPRAVADSAPATVVDVCPYQGLMPFDMSDSEWFFGREQLVAELVTYLSTKLTPPSMLAVVGPSGSGKSSLLRAGLVPTLADGVLPAVRDWPTVVLTPGARPLVALSTAVADVQIPGTAAPEPDEFADPERLQALVVRAFGPAPDRRILLVVDQLEELFMVCSDERERQAFVTALCNLAGNGRHDDGAPSPAVVVLCLRADFYGHCIAYPELIPVLAGGQLVVGPMTAGELRHAIVRPATRAGLELEPGLLDVLLADIGVGSAGDRPEPGSLPLLSHALLATWQLRDGHRLTLEGYRKAGGVHGAIATTAEAVHDRLEPDERTIVRRLFTRLVALGQGTEDTGRRIRYDELLDGRTDAEAAPVREILDTLAQARLVVLGSDTVEVAHEALIARWPRLQQWLTDDRDGLRIHRALTEAAQTWAALGRDPGALYRGARLSIARSWAERGDHRDDMNALERAFLDTSVELESSDEATARHRMLRSRQLVVAIVALLLLAVAGGALALWQARRNAMHDRAIRSQELARTALGLPVAQRPAAMLLAVEAFRTAPTPQARGALAALTPNEGYRDTLMPAGGVMALAFSPDGRTLAEANDDGAVTLWDHAKRRRRATLTASGAVSTAIAFSPDGLLLASGYSDGTVILWDLADRSRAATLATEHGPVHSMAFSPDGTVLASGSSGGALVLWDTAEHSQLATLDAGNGSAEGAAEAASARERVTSVAFSPDGTVLASGSSGGALVLWDAGERSRLATLAPVADDRTVHPVDALAFSPDGSTLAVAQSTAPPGGATAPDDSHTRFPIALWNVQRRALTGFIDTVAFDTVFTLAFSPDGGTFAIGTGTGVDVSDVSNGLVRGAPKMRYGGGPVTSLAFAPDGGTLAINEGGAAITLLDPSSRQIMSEARINRVAMHPDGTLLATMGEGPEVELWSIADRQRITTFDSLGYPYGDVAFSPSGHYAAWTGWDTVALHPMHDEEDGQTLRIMQRPEATRIPVAGGPRSVGFSEQSQRMFVADSYHEMVLVWKPGGPPARKRVPGLRSATLNPGGDVLATATSRGVLLWNFPELTEIGELGALERFQDEPLVTFSNDGSTLGTVDAEVVTLWDAHERTPITSFTEDDHPIDIAVAPDNRTVALAFEESIAIWDAAERVRTAEDLPLAFSYDNQVAFHDNGAMVAATDLDRIRFWDLDPQRAIARICSTLDRSLTREQWAEFLPQESYRATCA